MINSVKIRWMHPEDVDYVVNFCSDLNPEFIDNFLCDPRGVCTVILLDEKIVGFTFYKIKKYKIQINYIAVDPEFRRKKIATNLIKNIIGKLNKQRNKICVEIFEYNLQAQLLFKNMGFIANKIDKHTDGDTYLFEYSN